MEVEVFLQTFIAWASQQRSIEAVALAGSHARNAATEESDIDLIILTAERSRLLEEHDWLSEFGEVELYKKETWGAVETIRATYKNSLEVEYNFAAPSWAEVPVDPGTRRVVHDGFRILFDPRGKLAELVRQVRNVGN